MNNTTTINDVKDLIPTELMAHLNYWEVQLQTHTNDVDHTIAVTVTNRLRERLDQVIQNVMPITQYVYDGDPGVPFWTIRDIVTNLTEDSLKDGRGSHDEAVRRFKEATTRITDLVREYADGQDTAARKFMERCEEMRAAIQYKRDKRKVSGADYENINYAKGKIMERLNAWMKDSGINP